MLAGVATFWSAILVAAALEPGYSNRRDYVSTLAANGADHGELAVLGIVAAAASMIAAAVLVWPVSVVAAIAGAGGDRVRHRRLHPSRVPRRRGGRGLGGRFEISGFTEVGHWTATTVSSILLIGGMVIVGVTRPAWATADGHRVTDCRDVYRRRIPCDGRR